MNALLNTSLSSDVKITTSNSPKNLNEPSHKLPSYIGISVCVSGYSTYNKYSSEGNSPSTAIRRLNDPALHNNENSSLKLRPVQLTKPLSNGQYLDVNRTIESYNSFKNNLNRFNKLSESNNVNYSNQTTNHCLNHTTNYLSNLNNSNHLNQSNQFESFDNSLLSKDRSLLNDSSLSREEDDSKSLVQKRIESLYGQNFASNWKNRLEKSKSRIERGNNNGEQFRSPSCPPEFMFSSKKNLPVLKYIQNSVLNNNDAKDDDKPVAKQMKSELNGGDKLTPSKIKPTESNDLNSLINFYEKSLNSLTSCNDNKSINLIDKENFDKLNNLNLIKENESNNLDLIKDDFLFTDILLPEKKKEKVQENFDKLYNINEKSTDELDNTIKLNQPDILSNQLVQNNELNYPNYKLNDQYEEVYDGVWYLKKLDDEINKINEKIIQVEAINLDENLDNREEIDGKIRAAVGKSNLLINKKLSQFKDLCNLNQSPNEQLKVLDKDLEGFYEMVSYQIDDVHKTLDEILFLKNNNWIIHNDLLNPSPRKTMGSKNSSKANSKSSLNANSKPSSRSTSKEDLRRTKLREVKRKHQQQQQKSNDDIVIFLPIKNETKNDVL